MGQVRFVCDEARVVPLLNREVKPDELIELSDAVLQAHEWPEAQWDVVSSRKVFDPADERARVLAAERDGQARKGVLDNAEGI